MRKLLPTLRKGTNWARAMSKKNKLKKNLNSWKRTRGTKVSIEYF